MRELAHRGWLSFCAVADLYPSGDGGRGSRGNSAVAFLFAAVRGRAASITALSHAHHSEGDRDLGYSHRLRCTPQTPLFRARQLAARTVAEDAPADEGTPG